MENPTILYVISGDVFAGKEVQLLNLITELGILNIPTAVIIFNQGILSERLKSTNTKLYYIDEKKGFINLVFNTKRIIYEFCPSVVVSQDYKEAILAFTIFLFSKFKLILHFHGDLERKHGFAHLKMNLYYFLYKFIAKHFADALIFPCKYLEEKLSLSSKKSKIVFSSFSDSNESEKISFDQPAILCVGRLVQVKCFDRAIRAFMLFLDTYLSKESTAMPKLYIMGEGPERSYLEELVADLNLNEHVIFLGFKDNVLDYVKAASLLLISSEHEGAPTILLEAISKSTPIVSTGVGGIPEIMRYFETYNFKLVDKDNLVEMSTAINFVLSQVMSGSICQDNRKILSENFSAKIIANKHVDIYKSLMS